MKKNLKICIIDDHDLYGNALKLLLEVEGEFDSAGLSFFNNGKDGLKFLRKNVVDLLILDLNLPEKSGRELLPDLFKIDEKMQILIITAYAQPKMVKECMQDGCAGYLLKQNTFQDLLDAIEAIQAGESYLGKGVKIFAAGPGANPRENKDFNMTQDPFYLKNKLTKREKEVLDLIIEAKTNKEIAADLYISDQTVGVHRKNIMRKMAVNNTASLIKKAIELQMKNY